MTESGTRERLLCVAGPIFAAHGYDRVTIRELCAAAEVNIASVGYHFGDKMGLYRAVIQCVREQRLRRFPDSDNERSDPEKRILLIIRNLLSRMISEDESDWEIQLLIREIQRPTQVFETMVHECFVPQFQLLIDTLEELSQEKLPKYRLDQFALSVVGQCTYYAMGSGMIRILIPEAEREDHFDIDSLSVHIAAVTLAATRGGQALEHDEAIRKHLSAPITTERKQSSFFESNA